MRSRPEARRGWRAVIRPPRAWHNALLGFLLLLAWAPARAGDISVAVAANFTAPAKEIAAAFYAETGKTVDFSFGSSGQLYAQITQGAPFDILLSADPSRPRKAEEDGFAVPGSRFTYAIGKLALWSADAGLIDPEGMVLRRGTFTHIAIANPDAAPYGTAAVEALKALGLYDRIAAKIVQGETITQTYQFVASGNAELGFVALSQVVGQGKGSSWVVPETLYAPILQDAVLLKSAAQNRSAKAFLAFLKGPRAVTIIRRYGYGLPPGT